MNNTKVANEQRIAVCEYLDVLKVRIMNDAKTLEFSIERDIEDTVVSTGLGKKPLKLYDSTKETILLEVRY